MTISRDEQEAERDFLLRSLDDLDDELVAGNIDPDTYRELHDDYTARASAVIQSIDDGSEPSRAEAPRASVVMRAVTIVGIVAFCVIGAFLLAHAIGPRASGQTSTGNDQASRNAPSPQDAVNANPRDYNARIVYARQLLASQDYTNAIVQYTAAAGIDPKQPEPFAYRGWISALVAMQLTDPQEQALLVQRATSDLNEAIALDRSYPDTYAFKGVMLLRVEHKPADAVPVLQQFLLLTPTDNAMRAEVLAALKDAQTQSTKP